VIEGCDGAGRPLTADSLYPVASLTKLATALAVLRLADTGRLAPEDELARHLPDAAAAVPGATLRHLLAHTGGLAVGLAETEVPYREATWPALAAAYLRSAPERPPGTAFQYGNIGYGLLGVLVERLTGLRVGAALTSLVLEPLGIEGYLGDEPPRTPAVVAGVGGAQAGTAFEALNSAFWRSLSLPGDGLVTTVTGAVALVSAFAGDPPGFLRPETLALATSDQSGGLPTVPGATYDFMRGPWGLGPELHGGKPYWAPPEAGPASFGHVGSSGCVAWASPAAGVAWAVLTSQAMGAPDHWLFTRAPALGRAVLG
jgi:CubicO group peptidase (beta-lactamase class C family)